MSFIKIVRPRDMKPLFLPVNSLAFFWYMTGKDVEIRNSRNWNERTVIDGRLIKVSKGYSGPSWMGAIGNEIFRGTLDQILEEFTYERIVPITGISEYEAHKKISEMVKDNPKDGYIAFNIIR